MKEMEEEKENEEEEGKDKKKKIPLKYGRYKKKVDTHEVWMLMLGYTPTLSPTYLVQTTLTQLDSAGLG